MAGFSTHKIFGILIRESADDGSDFSTPDADYRILFLGEDGDLHAKDSADAVTTVGGSGGSGQGLVDCEFHSRKAGDYTINNTSWTNLDTGTDLVLTASTGDTIEVGASMVWGSEATTACLDVATIVSASPVNYVGASGGAGDFGISSWIGTTGQTESAGAPTMYTLVSGDISGGTVTLRLRYRTTSSTNKTLRASATLPFLWWAKNLGPAM